MRSLYWLMFVFFLALAQTACNTVQGVGQDVEEAGEALGDLADDAEDELED